MADADTDQAESVFLLRRNARRQQVVYLIDDDLDATDLPPEQTPVSDEVEEREADWMPQLLRSTVTAGLAQNAVGTPAR